MAAEQQMRLLFSGRQSLSRHQSCARESSQMGKGEENDEDPAAHQARSAAAIA